MEDDDYTLDDQTDETAAQDDGLGGLSVTEPAYFSAISKQISSNISALQQAANALRAKRTEPTKQDKLLAIAAAMSQPTKFGSFGESLGNLTKSMVEQRQTQREAEEKKAELLQKYSTAIGGQYDRLMLNAIRAKQAENVAARAAEPKTGFNPVTGVLEYTTGPNAGTPVRGGASVAPAAPRTVVIDGVTYPVNQKGELTAPVPQRDRWVDTVRNGRRGQVNAATGEFKEYPKEAQAPATAANLVDPSTVRKAVDELISHPGLEAVVGVPNPFGGVLGTNEKGEPRIVPGTSAAGFYAKHKQVTGQAFLSARQMLKGGGAITDFESKKAEGALAAMDLSQDEASYKKAAKDFADAVEAGARKLRAAQSQGAAPRAASRSAPAGKVIVRRGTYNGRAVVQYDDGTTAYAN